MDRMTKEAIRYLGYGRNAVDEQTLALIKDSFEGLRSAVSPKSICRIFDLQHQSEECFQIGNIRMKSRSLGRNLKQCEKLILFGATLGTGADRLIYAGISDRHGKSSGASGLRSGHAGGIL